jgi:hypothetical protein
MYDNVEGLIRRPARRAAGSVGRMGAAGWRINRVELNRVPRRLRPMGFLSQGADAWQTMRQRHAAWQGAAVGYGSRWAGCGCVSIASLGAGVRHHRRGRQEDREQRGKCGLVHEVSWGRGAKMSTMRIGAPQIGHGASGRSVSLSSSASPGVSLSRCSIGS